MVPILLGWSSTNGSGTRDAAVPGCEFPDKPAGSSNQAVAQLLQWQAGCRDHPVGRPFSTDGNQLVDRILGQVAVNDGGHHQLVQRNRAFVIIEERGVGGVTTGGYAHQGLPRR